MFSKEIYRKPMSLYAIRDWSNADKSFAKRDQIQQVKQVSMLTSWHLTQP